MGSQVPQLPWQLASGLGNLTSRWQATHSQNQPEDTADRCQSFLYDFCKLIPSSAGNGTSHVRDERALSQAIV